MQWELWRKRLSSQSSLISILLMSFAFLIPLPRSIPATNLFHFIYLNWRNVYVFIFVRNNFLANLSAKKSSGNIKFVTTVQSTNNFIIYIPYRTINNSQKSVDNHCGPTRNFCVPVPVRRPAVEEHWCRLNQKSSRSLQLRGTNFRYLCWLLN